MICGRPNFLNERRLIRWIFYDRCFKHLFFFVTRVVIAAACYYGVRGCRPAQSLLSPRVPAGVGERGGSHSPTRSSNPLAAPRVASHFRQDAIMTGRIEGLQRFDSPGKGRGLRVTKAFKVGDLLFSCRPYSYVLSAKERGCYCECCFAR